MPHSKCAKKKTPKVLSLSFAAKSCFPSSKVWKEAQAMRRGYACAQKKKKGGKKKEQEPKKADRFREKTKSNCKTIGAATFSFFFFCCEHFLIVVRLPSLLHSHNSVLEKAVKAEQQTKMREEGPHRRKNKHFGERAR